MKCKCCNAELNVTAIKEIEMAYCCNEWQVKEDSLRPKVKDSYWYKEKGSK